MDNFMQSLGLQAKPRGEEMTKEEMTDDEDEKGKKKPFAGAAKPFGASDEEDDAPAKKGQQLACPCCGKSIGLTLNAL